MSARVVVVFDTDSYAAWGIRLADAMPADWTVRLVALSGYVEASDRQLDNAVIGTRFATSDIERLHSTALKRRLHEHVPDVLLLAVRGHVVPFLLEPYRAVPERPVVVTGFPGIALPPQDYDFHHRRSADLWVVHSRHERVELAKAAVDRGRDLRLGLATLPLVGEPPAPTTGSRNEVVFATQALVPAMRVERLRILQRLADAASADPELTFVVKTRSVRGEAETHRRGVGYDELVGELDSTPTNLVVSAEPMRDHLSRAVGLVTVSSTAALEAIANDVEVIVLSDFGVDDVLMNKVFEGSGLLGTLDDVVATVFRHADPSWLADNYFHDPAENDWLAQIQQLLDGRAAAGSLPKVGRVRSGFFNDIYYRRDAISPWHGTPVAPLERAALAAARWVNRLRGR